MDNEELIEAHHLDQVRRGLQPRSIRKRDDCIRALGRCHASLLDVTRTEVERFLDVRRNRAGQAITNRTRYAWLAHFHGFYGWAIREDLTTEDPTAKIIRPKVKQGLPRPAATDELRAALERADPMRRCWLLLAAFMGLRCQEIAGIEREDVLDTQGLLHITKGKGGKDRMVPIHPDVLAALKALPMPKAGRVFHKPMGGTFTPQHLSHEFNAFLKSAGCEATAHQLRHWFGTNLYQQTQDIRLCQEMLGHADPATTAIYTKFDARKAGAAVCSISFDPT